MRKLIAALLLALALTNSLCSVPASPLPGRMGVPVPSVSMAAAGPEVSNSPGD